MPDAPDTPPADAPADAPPQDAPPAGGEDDNLDVDKLKDALRKERESAKNATKAEKAAAKQLAELTARLQEFENRDLTEQQKAEKRLQQLEQELASAQQTLAERERAAARFRVAAEKGLPADLVDRLIGEDEESLAADADRLLALLGSTRRTPDFDAGIRTPPPSAPDMNALIRGRLGGR